MHDHLHMADLGEDEFPLAFALGHYGKTALMARSSILREGQAMIAKSRLETRIADLLARINSSKK